jgi:hypothetical protein
MFSAPVIISTPAAVRNTDTDTSNRTIPSLASPHSNAPVRTSPDHGEEGVCLVWLETTVSRGVYYNHRGPSDRRILNERLCIVVNNTRSASTDTATTTATIGTTTPEVSRHIGSAQQNNTDTVRSPPCLYIPFSLEWLNSSEKINFSVKNDPIHFTHMEIYHKRNMAALDACHLIKNYTQ